MGVVAVRSPKRIQMSRQKPWRADNPDAVIVARPSKWGNPYRVGDEFLNDKGLVVDRVEDAADAVGRFRQYVARIGLHMLVRRNLAGRDLACWCPLDQPCHADVLLELANGDTK